jgi:predicted transposase/invertase (TIGR01784 family)
LFELLSDILGRPLKDVKIRGNEPPLGDVGAKREVFDINCVAVDDHSQFDVEMQATPMEADTLANGHMYIRNRSVFNLCDLHANQPGRGVRYGDFMRSYQITICNYGVFSWENRLAETFTYRNDGGEQLSDMTTAIFIDLTQAGGIAKKQVPDMTAIEQWAVFFAKANDPKHRELINEILKRKEGISVAYEMLTSISTDEDERARFRFRRMWEMDRAHEKAAREIEQKELLEKVAQAGQRATKWERVATDKDKTLADKDARIAELERMLNTGR